MSAELGWCSAPTLSWIRQILFERFGQNFSINVLAEGFLQLELPNVDGSIELIIEPSNFNGIGSDIPCCSWTAADEGWALPLGKPLPVPGSSALPLPLVEKTETGHRINYDILGLAYWMLSRKEEVGRHDLDEHDRFPATSSHAFKNGYLDRPIVDEWLDILAQVIRCQWKNIKLKEHAFSMQVSHDVDIPSAYMAMKTSQVFRSMAGSLVKRFDLRDFIFVPWIWFRRKRELHSTDIYNSFDWIMDVSESQGLQSTFYFICGRTDPVRDAAYEPEFPAIRKLMRRIHSRSHLIGLHPSYNTFKKPDGILMEAKKLRKVCSKEGIIQPEMGARMHFLRWEHPTTMYELEKAKMAYDNTLGYADMPGFRCGTCYEYPAFDPVKMRILQLRIRPLIAMECTIMAQRYMGLGTGDEACNKFLKLKGACRAMNGCFSLLWHNSELTGDSGRKLYRSVLEG